MKRTWVLLLIAAATLTPSVPAQAADRLERQMRQITRWLSDSFALPAAEVLPKVVRVSPERMRAVRLGGARRRPAAVRGGEIEALYEDRTRTIYLRREWRGRTPGEISVLVHELVHHLQNMGGLMYECPQARERPAYVAQDRWLARSGLNLLDEFHLDPMTVLVRTRCMSLY